MSDLDRDSERSLTGQLVETFATAIEAGELEPGEKLPPTRELAELAGVNHLTAVRAYRRLREMGLVSAHVGRGTFVRETAPSAPGKGVADSIAWQRYALPEPEADRSVRVMAEMHGHARAGGLIPLSVGYPSDRLLPVGAIAEAMAEAIAAAPERALQYGEVEGAPELAEQVAALSSSSGAAEDPRDVVVTTGALQGLHLTARALLRPGDVAACESPTFMGMIGSIRATGARLLGVPSDEDGLDVDALEELLGRHEIRLLALQTRVGNPTGRDLSPARAERLVALARRHGFFILEDGVYSAHRFEGPARPPLRSRAPAHVIYVDSLSKTIGGGLRVGWVIASGPVHDRIAAAKLADDMHSPMPTQLAAARLLGSGAYAEHVARTVPEYALRREAMLDALERHLAPAARWIHPLGGHHVWVELDLPVEERDLLDEARRAGVTFVPGGAMSVERPRGLSLRLSYCYCDGAAIEEGVRRLAVAVQGLRGRRERATALPV